MRKLPLWIILSSIGMLAILALLIDSKPANAQCGIPTSCNTCHEVQGQYPVGEKGIWHSQHKPYNACVLCHGGNKDVNDPALAHQGVTTSLSDMQSACANCHPKDVQARYKQYADQAGVSSQITTSSTSNNGIARVLGSGPANVAEEPQETSMPSTLTATPENQRLNWILGSIFAVGILGGGSYIAWNEQRKKQRSGSQLHWPAWIFSQIRQENWSPYMAGILLGVIAILAVVIGNHLLSASNAIATGMSSILSQVFPALADNMYFKFIMPPGFNWPIALMIGIFLGGFLSSLSSGTFRLRWNDDPTWQKVFGKSRLKRFLIGFAGAIILQYGAGIAGGCTSGLAISGGMLMAPSAFLFMAGMFASGILVAILVYRRRY